jgi:hypothetical protein
MLVRFGNPRQTASTASNVKNAMFAIVAHFIRRALARTIGAREGAGLSQLKLLRRGDFAINCRFTRRADSVRHERRVPTIPLVDDRLAPTTNAFHSPLA